MATTNIRWAAANRLLDRIRTRKVTDGVTTNSDATLTSATAAFTAIDVDRPISGTGIPSSATIASVTNATTIELSAAATATGTGVTITIGDTDLDGVQYEAGWPGDQAGGELIWLSEIEGEVTIPLMNAGRKYRDDRFRIPLEFRVVADGRTLDATQDRLAAVMAAVENELANDPGLDGLDGVISAEVERIRSTSEQFANLGWVAFGELVVAVHARLE